MARAARFGSSHHGRSRSRGWRVPRPQLVHMRAAFRELLGQRSGQRADQWRQSILQSLRILTGSDKAILVVRTGLEPAGYADGVSREVLSAYVTRFAHLDRSRSAGRDLEAWSLSRAVAAGRAGTERILPRVRHPQPASRYGRPDAPFPEPPERSLPAAAQGGPGALSSLDQRRDLLEVLLEPVRAGFAVDLSATDPAPQLSSLIDVTGQALVLFGLDGRELSQNPVMRRMLGQEREREALLEHVRGVARAVLARVTNGEIHCSRHGARPRTGPGVRWPPVRRPIACAATSSAAMPSAMGPRCWSRSTASRSRCPHRTASAPATASPSGSCRWPP